jgi:hypothetical protein
VTKPIPRKSRGRPPKHGPKLPARPAHRPTPDFWRDPDRLLFAHELMMIARGESKRRALLKSAAGQRLTPPRRPEDEPESELGPNDPLTYRGIWFPEPGAIEEINRKRRRARRDKPIRAEDVLLCMPPRRGGIAPANRIRGWDIKLKSYRRDPVVEAWLSIMAGFLYSRLQRLPPLSSIEAAAMGARVEALVKTAADRISA